MDHEGVCAVECRPAGEELLCFISLDVAAIIGGEDDSGFFICRLDVINLVSMGYIGTIVGHDHP